MIAKMDARRIDALDQWLLRMLLGTDWYEFARNDDVRRLTKQPKLTAIIQSRRLTGTLFGHRRQCRCQEDPVSLPSGGLEKTTRSSLHHMAQHRPTGSETTPPYTLRSRFGSEQPSVWDDVERYTISEFHARNDDVDYHREDNKHMQSINSEQ